MTGLVLTSRFGFAQDVEERMLKWSEGMGPRFISWNAAALITYELTLPDVWSRKLIKAIPSRKPEVSTGHWNDVYTPADDKFRMKWPRQGTEVILEVTKVSRGGVYLTTEEVAPHGEELAQIVINDQVFYRAGHLTIPDRLDTGVDMRQRPSGPLPKPDNGGKKEDADKENQEENDPVEVIGDKMSEFDLGALERDLLEYDFNEAEDGGANEMPVLMTPSLFKSPTSPRLACLPWSLDPRLKHTMDELLRVAFLRTLPKKEWERYRSKLERKTDEAWTLVALMESSSVLIRRYGTRDDSGIESANQARSDRKIDGVHYI